MWILEARQRVASSPIRLSARKHANVKVSPGGFPQRRAADLPFVAVDQLRELQKGAIEAFHLDPLQITENAGRAAATLALAMLGGRAQGQRIIVLAGGGSMGAAGLAAVRHLSNWGFTVEPIFGEIAEEMTPIARRQAEILRATGMHEHNEHNSSEESLREHMGIADLIIDSLVGYGLSGPPVGIAAAAAELAVASGRPILSLDVPTGVDAQSGGVYQPAIRAVTTLLLDLPKRGMLEASCKDHVGQLFLADIGIPTAAHARAGIRTEGIYAEGPIVRIKR
jgi:NAD(P)H-hydrate epimerase